MEVVSLAEDCAFSSPGRFNCRRLLCWEFNLTFLRGSPGCHCLSMPCLYRPCVLELSL